MAEPNFVAKDFSWSSIPTELLLAELSRRENPEERPQCGSGRKGHYDTPLHVFALFLILTLSTLTCGFPLFSRRGQAGRRPNTIAFLCQHFGTGVLIATAFVHLLPTAFNSLTDPCLPYAFSKGYRPLAGLIAMVSAIVVVGLESYLTTRGAGHSHSHHVMWDEDDDEGDKSPNLNPQGDGFGGRRETGHRPLDTSMEDRGDIEGLIASVSPLLESTPIGRANRSPSPFKDGADGNHDSDDDHESLDLELNLDELDPVPMKNRAKSGPSGPSGSSAINAPSPEEQKRLMLQCMLLEAGILFHSVFIGMALSVATGPTFVVFLIAISLHQSFEGLALGSRIAAIQFPRSSPKPWLMVLAYGTTTPIGQAIGLFVHNLYDPMGQTGLLMVGFMNAISSGLLLFAGLVQLLAEDFLTEKSYKTLHGKKRIHAFAAVCGGAVLMAAVGAFA